MENLSHVTIIPNLAFSLSKKEENLSRYSDVIDVEEREEKKRQDTVMVSS